MNYEYNRDRYSSAQAAVDCCSAATALKRDPMIQAALMQIDIAERAIASRAQGIECSLPDED